MAMICDGNQVSLTDSDNSSIDANSNELVVTCYESPHDGVASVKFKSIEEFEEWSKAVIDMWKKSGF